MNNKDKFGEVITPHHFIESMVYDCKNIMKNDFSYILSFVVKLPPGAKSLQGQKSMKNSRCESKKVTF